jgi:LAO/AO transport system kinase
MDQEHLELWLNRRRERRTRRSVDQLLSEMRDGSREALSSSITLIESTRPEDRKPAAELISKCLPFTGKSVRIGITGVPGVGKSTFIESFGKLLVESGKKVAVLAIDPSSSSSGGSILGDKTRMQELSVMEQVFIRPTAAGTILGGVARKTRESIFLCEAAGFDVILVETVGVGQSETLVHSMVDFFLLLMLAGAGDELQGIKRGIMEMADALVITKADSGNEQKAQLAQREYANAMHLFPPRANKWIPQAMTVSSIERKHIDKVWTCIESFVNQNTINGSISSHRNQQNAFWLNETLKELILNDFYAHEEVLQALKKSETLVQKGELSSLQAAEQLYALYIENQKKA